MIEKVVLNGEEHKLSPDYKDIRNKPSINGVELKDGDNKIEIIDINIDPDVDIVEEGETPSVVNTGTSKSPILKFSLPKGETGETGKTYVPSVDEAGNLSWNLQDVTEQTPLPETVNVRGPEGHKGDAAKNPFKGYYPDGTDKPTGEFSTGDYIYAPDDTENSTDTTIWSWDSTLNDGAGGWNNTSVVIDPASLAEFLSGESVATTKIKPLFEDEESKDVATAEGVKRFYEEVYGKEEEIITDINLSLMIKGGFRTRTEDSEEPSFVAAAGSGTASNYPRTYEIPLVDASNNLKYDKLRIKAGDKPTYYTFLLNRIPKNSGLYPVDGSMSYQQLIDGEYLDSSIYTGKEHVLDSILANSTVDIEISSINTPNTPKYLYIIKHSTSTSTDYTPISVKGVKLTKGKGDIDTIREDIDENTQTLDSKIDTIPIGNIYDALYGEGSEVDGDDVKYDMHISILSNSIISGSNSIRDGYYIDVSKYKELVITANKNENSYIIITKEGLGSNTYDVNTFISTKAAKCNKPTVEGEPRMIVPAGTTKKIYLSDDAIYLYIQKTKANGTDGDLMPSSMVFTERVDGVYDKVMNMPTVTPLSLKYGEYNDKGIFTDSKSCVTTGLIALKGYYIELHDAYRFKRESMFNDRGEMVTYNAAVWGNVVGEFWGLVTALPQFSVKLTIIRKDGNDIDINDNIIKRFFYLDNIHFKKQIPDNLGIDYALFQKKINILTKPIWYAFNKIIVGTRTGVNSNYFLKGGINRGTPYTQCDEYSNFVGQHTSLRTFFTALMNKRSVMYTEDVGAMRSKSSYGLQHHCYNVLAGSYYGTVCSGLASWLLNFLSIHTSYYTDNKISIYGLKTFFIGRNYDKDGNLITDCLYKARKDTNNNIDFNEDFSSFNTIDEALNWIVDNIQVGDLLSKKGHVFIIGDIYTNEEGEREIICVLEQTKPRERYIPYPIDRFKDRIRTTNSGRGSNDADAYPDITIARRTINNNTKDVRTYIYDDDLSYIQTKSYDYNPKVYSIDEDITTFRGEYVTFTTLADDDPLNNNKAFLNIHRDGNNSSGGYTHLQIFNETTTVSNNTEPLAEYTLDDNNLWITESIKNQENQLIYEEDSSDKEDWIIFDLKKISTLLNAGKYKARVVRKIVDENTTSITRTSGFTHWEMIGIDFSIVVDTTQQTVEAKYNTTGIPYMIRMESIAGSGANNGDRFKTLESAVFSDSDNLYHLNLNDWFQFYSPNTDDKKRGTGFIKIFVQGEYNDCVLRKVFNPDGTENPQDDGTETDGTA